MGAVALFLVLAGGTAYAADTVLSSDIKDGEVHTEDLANLAVTAGKLNNSSVGKNKVAGNAIDSARIADGTIGAQDLAAGVSGPRAYGLIQGTGHTRDKNVVAVTNPVPGLFCIQVAAGIDPNASSAVATPDYTDDQTLIGDNNNQAVVEVETSIPACGSNLAIETFVRSVGTGSEAGGTVVRTISLTRQNQPFFFVLG
jgi:hypothetical protein